MTNIPDEYIYNCVKCGNCCRVGSEISISKNDIQNWINIGKLDLSLNFYIDPKSISTEGLGGYHIEKKNALFELLKRYGEHNYELKKQELREFILKNHIYEGEGIIPLPVYTFIEELGRMPILIPRNYDVLFEGIDRGLDYLILYQTDGKCPFLEDNLCTIHEIKPLDCKTFPHNEKGALKTDRYFLKICQGIKKRKIQKKIV